MKRRKKDGPKKGASVSTESQSVAQFAAIEEESRTQALPDQKAVFSVAEKIRRRAHNLPDPTHAPLGWDEQKGFERVYPYLRLPVLHPPNHGDTVIFNAPELPANKLVLGDNLEFLRTLKSETVDLIYIDPPFFSGRNYNIIWGDSNEIRTFQDIWEGGLDSYLIWLNARLWEMRRVLKKTGSIYVHCDWHASHYIKTEMDKIFGYDNFVNEIIWSYEGTGSPSKTKFASKHDIVLRYAKNIGSVLTYDLYFEQEIDTTYSTLKKDDDGKYFRIQGLGDYSDESIKRLEKENRIYVASSGKKYLKHWVENRDGKLFKDKKLSDVWTDITQLGTAIQKEKIGYPTQKPETLLERIVKASSDDDSVIADFFMGGGTTLAVAQRLKRKFIGCDSSRVAVSVTLDRLVKGGEIISGVKSNLHKTESGRTESLNLSREKIPNIQVSYIGTYPVEKFEHLPHENFVEFVLTAYGASRNTGGGVTHGYRPPAQQEPILVGPASPKDSIDADMVRQFFDEIKARLEPNKMVRAKVIGWRFDRRVVEYVNILRRYIEKHTLPLEIDLLPLDSKEFRRRVLQRYPDAEEGTTLLRLSKAPVIGEIRHKKTGAREYQFEAVDAFSTNEDGWLVNCQWDFDYQEGHFSADKDYILSREKAKDKKRGERFVAVLSAKHRFDANGPHRVACRVQDNFGGETILAVEVNVES